MLDRSGDSLETTSIGSTTGEISKNRFTEALESLIIKSFKKYWEARRILILESDMLIARSTLDIREQICCNRVNK